MKKSIEDGVWESLCQLYPAEKCQTVISDLIVFVGRRIAGAESRHAALKKGALESSEIPHAVRSFTGEAWNALDGTGRLINCALFPRYPSAGLMSPPNITPQCTFYTVRRDLHRDSEASDHPLSRIMWQETRDASEPSYERLSLYYHLTQFLPLRLNADKQLPGWTDLPDHVRDLMRHQNVDYISPEKGVNQIWTWERTFLKTLFELIAEEAVMGDDWGS